MQRRGTALQAAARIGLDARILTVTVNGEMSLVSSLSHIC